MSGEDLNITCVAVGSPMPYVKWQSNGQDYPHAFSVSALCGSLHSATSLLVVSWTPPDWLRL